MGKLITEDIARAETFHEIFRVIDDICALIDGGDFQKFLKERYINELVVTLECTGSQYTFLHLTITISNG